MRGDAKDQRSHLVQSAGAKRVSKPARLEVPELRVAGVEAS